MKIVAYVLSLALAVVCFALAIELGSALLLPDAYRGYLIDRGDGTATWGYGPFDPAQPATGLNTPVTLKKPEDTFRIIALGASGTEGWLTAKVVFQKYQQDGALKSISSYSRAIEFSMNEIAEPGSKKVEVINLGIAAYNVTDVIRMLKDSLMLEPDLFIIQIGGNETWTAERKNWSSYISNDIPYLNAELAYEVFTGRQGGWSTLKREGNAFNPLALYAKGTKTRPINKEPEGRKEGLESRLSLYKSGLERLGDYLEAKGIPAMFLVPSQNIADFLPFGSMAKTGSSEQQIEELNTLLLEALSAPEEEAKPKFERVLELDDGIAEANFQMGKIALREGDSDKAREYFWKANDRDLVLKRLPGSFHDATREFLANRSFPFIDVTKFYESKSNTGVVGYNWLDDDVHPHRQGQFDLGIKIINTALESGLVDSADFSADLSQAPTFDDYNDWTGFDQESLGIIEYMKAAHNYLSFGRYSQRLKWEPNPEPLLQPMLDQLNTASTYTDAEQPLYVSMILNLYLGNNAEVNTTIDKFNCEESTEQAALTYQTSMVIFTQMMSRGKSQLRTDLQNMLSAKGCVK